MARDLIIELSELDESKVIADLDEIRRLNRQRFEMEQLTAIVYEDTERKICAGYKDYTPDDFWVRGHMPDMPVLPGVLMCEAAAQLSSYMARRHSLIQPGYIMGFGGMDEVRFRGVVKPGDRLLLVVEMVRHRTHMVVCHFQGFVRGNLVVEGMIRGVPLPMDRIVAAESSE